MKDYSNLSGYQWMQALRDHPELSIHADWSKLDGWDYSYLLINQPHLSNYCDWSRLGEHDWARLLKNQPQLCNTEELQSMAVSKSKEVLNLLKNPSERIKRLHTLKWKI